MIQYCDTEDRGVLKELKEWLEIMDEVQRTVMVTTLRYMPYYCYDDSPDLLFPILRELYKAIREYDISSKSESEIEWLKELGLIE